jgi:RNA polymerase sigma-70 factor (ECF subfamily)
MSQQHDTMLLRRAREGSAEALDALYARCAVRLLAFIRARLGPSLRAELESRDILQATFLKSIQHFAELEADNSRSLMAWLARIAEREIRDQADYRNRERRDARRNVPLDEALERVTAHLRSALSLAALGEQAERLERALDALDADHREVILLRSYQEMSFREIGERMGRREDACRMLYARAMAALTIRMREAT